MRIIALFSGMLLWTAVVFAQNGGTINDSKTVNSKILKMDRKYSVYLPADYETSDRIYPVLYLLHPAGPGNTTPNHQSWFMYGELKHYLDKAIASGEIAPMIVVSPDANFGSKRISYFNDPENDFSFEDFFFKEFVPHVEKTYRVGTNKELKAIAGASLGGAAALQYAIHQPDDFAVVAALSAVVRRYDVGYLKNRYPEVSENTLIEWYKPYDVLGYLEGLTQNTDIKQKWYIACGDDDRLSSNNAALHAMLMDKGIPHEFRIHNGAHDWTYWRAVTAEFTQFISAAFRK